MSNEKRNVETEEIKEARQLSEEELEKVSGGKANTVGVIPIIFAQTIVPMSLQIDPE